MTDQEIRKKAKELLEKNTISGYSKEYGIDYHYMKPGRSRYPFQYFWDTCFHVYTMTALGDHQMAKRCMQSLFAMQRDDGFVGHMLFWSRFTPTRLTDIFQSKPSIRDFFWPHMSALLQPPLVAQAVLRIYSYDKDISFLQQMLPKLKLYYDWLASNRDFDGDGLLSIISYFEAGMDWKPSYDEVVGFAPGRASAWHFMKVVYIDFKNYLHNYDLKKIYQANDFLVKDTGFNTVYAQNLQAMAEICRLVGDPDAVRYQKLGNKVTQSIVDIMYDEQEEAFFDVYGRNNKKLKVLTPTIFFPATIKGMPGEIGRRVIERHFFNKEEFAAPYPIPSVAMNHPSFNPKESIYIWRGPTWVIYNWFLHHFLMEKGFKDAASNLVRSTKELIQKGGFREYYNPFTGAGYGAYDFTWSGLVVDMMNMEEGLSPEAVTASSKESFS
jgi:glycogen debranching enzyme